ncbi:MAG: hypothetical protein K6E47_08185 [Lachnospiraceae bacterium]|nr:hypothetical protein [Lachnospiraceae bacterium]
MRLVLIGSFGPEKVCAENAELITTDGREVYNVIHRDKVDTGKRVYYEAIIFYRDDL